MVIWFSLIALAVVVLFVIYFVAVLRYRGHVEHRKEREKGLDPLR